MNGRLICTATSSNGSNSIYSNATSDYSHTIHFYADPLTSGVTLVSASGHNYATPAAVPEPGSIALILGFGTTGAGFLFRRKQARKAA